MLSLKVHSEHGEEMYLNADRIVSISKSGEGSCIQTITEAGNCKAYHVSETPKTVMERAWQSLQQNPPIITFTAEKKAT